MEGLREIKEWHAKNMGYNTWGDFLLKAEKPEVNMALNVIAEEYREARDTEFYQDVKRMRELQKEYFKTRRKDVLASSKTIEAKVDRQIYETENPTLL